MPKRKLVRRFEPRYGVSREMIEIEAKYVAREVEDHFLSSLTGLREQFIQARSAWKGTDQTLQGLLKGLPERYQLALQRMVVRDVYHILELYIEYVKTHIPREIVGTHGEAVAAGGELEVNPLPFSEWLFGER